MKKKILLFIMLFASLFMIIGCSKDAAKKLEKVENEEIDINEVTIPEGIILDENNIKITAKSLEYDDQSVILNLIVENDTENNIKLNIGDFYINDIYIDIFTSGSIIPGENTFEIIASIGNLKEARISIIKDIEMNISANTENNEIIFRQKKVKLKTNATDYVQEYNSDGTLLFDENGIKAYALNLEMFDWGADLYIYVENNTSKSINLTAKIVSVNGIEIDGGSSFCLIANKKIYTIISIDHRDLENNNIDDIKEIGIKFFASSTSGLEEILDTDTIKISLK